MKKIKKAIACCSEGVMAKIERSTGIVVPGWHGPRPGGGYSGITEALDVAVVRAAEALRDITGQDVEIRFNSDRLSGGGFLKLPTPELPGCTLGICAQLSTAESRAVRAIARERDVFSSDVRASNDPKIATDVALRIAADPDDRIAIAVNAGVNRLSSEHEHLADRGNFMHEYAYVWVDDVAAAVAWIREHCEDGGIGRRQRVSDAELVSWSDRRVKLVDGGEVGTILRAVEDVGSALKFCAQYGGGDRPMSGVERTEDAVAHYLREEKRVSPRHAREIARGVFRLLPRGWDVRRPSGD